MAEKIMDMTSSLVTPLLIYFGEKGIAPKVLSVEGEEVLTLEKAQGFRLGRILGERRFDTRAATETYSKLGEAVGIISRHNVVHGHLHSDNVVVTIDNRPIIIDWDQASYLPLSGADDTWYTRNLVCLVEDLRGSGRKDKEELERVVMDSFDRSLRTTPEFSYQQLEKAARPLLYSSS